MLLTHVPAAVLRPFVSAMIGYRMPAADALHFGVPEASATLVLPFDTALDIGWTEGGSTALPSVLSGLHTAPTIIRTAGTHHGMQLALTPAGIRALTGAPISTLQGVLTAVPEAVAGAGTWAADLQACADWPARFALLERLLIARLPVTVPEVPVAARTAWQLMAASGGRARVAETAAVLGISRRRLLTVVRAEFGLSPKELLRVHRFAAARRAAAAGRRWADIAAECGYADQAHLSREWQALAGRSPQMSMRLDPPAQAQVSPARSQQLSQGRTQLGLYAARPARR